MNNVTVALPGNAGERIPRANGISDRIAMRTFLWQLAQVGLILAVAVLYRVELERGFGVVAGVMFVGFVIHSWLPIRWRLSFFLLLTLTALIILLGWNAFWLVSIGLSLLGLCHLPVNWWVRVVALFLAATGLALIQVGLIEVPWGPAVIPLLGAIFMFRIMLYMYDLKNERSHASRLQRITYFFMLPNLCFPLFPVVDYKTFIIKYYDVPDASIYQKGLLWMLRGVIHLLLYRLIYYYFLPQSDGLEGILGVYTFMAFTYALYLRVSGLFHLIVGSLCLFGFNLPPTNNKYFLASSFADLWRRINIYWKDFMMTVVFYPIFMSTRRHGIRLRLIVATGMVFIVTWLLHSYQWFWLLGVFPVTSTDIAFWGVLGLGLAINSLWESARGRKRRLKIPNWGFVTALRTTLQTMIVFTVMAILWTLWDSGSFAEWWYRLIRVEDTTPSGWLRFAILIGSMTGLGMFAQAMNSKGWGLERAEQVVWSKSRFLIPAAAAALLVVWPPLVHQRLNRSIENAILLAQSTKLNSIDALEQERGYYETLTRTSWLNPSQDEGFEQDQVVSLLNLGAAGPTEDVRAWALVPNTKTIFKGATFETNRWGLRDREYSKKKPLGSYRIAIVGSSHVMGSGVANNETLDNVLEDRLNTRHHPDLGGWFEILNFSVGGYGLLQTLYVTEKIVPPFEPDVVIYVVHPREVRRSIQRMRRVMNPRVTIDSDYQYLMDVMIKADAQGRLPDAEFARRMEPYEDDIVAWGFRRKVAAIRSMGATPVFVYLPLTDTRFEKAELRVLSKIAQDAGALNIVIDDVYSGHSVETLRVAEWDNHPNVKAHEIIANRLYAELLANHNALHLSDLLDVTSRSQPGKAN